MPGPLGAQTVLPDSTTAFPALSMGLGARAVGMGGSFTAVADDLSAVYYNPAGLAQIPQPEIGLTHNSYLGDGFFDNLDGLYPCGTAGTLALGLNYLNYGSIDQRDNAGNQVGTYTPFDMGVEGAFGFSLDSTTFLGLSSQWVQQNIAGTVYSALMWDVGTLLKPSDLFSLGLDLKNLGVDSGGGNLPAELLWGAAYRLSLAEKDSHLLLISAGGNLVFRGVSTLNAGFEYGFEKSCFLRAGYEQDLQDNQLDGLQGLNFGAGVRLGQFQFDYSFSFEGDLGNIQRFSLSFFFAPPAKAIAASGGLSPASVLMPPLIPGLPFPELGQASSASSTAPSVSIHPDNKPVLLRFEVTSEDSLTAQQLFDQAERKLRLGLKKEALDLYLKALDKNPNDEKAWNRLGRLYFDLSLDSYRKALQLDPQNDLLREWLNHFQEH